MQDVYSGQDSSRPIVANVHYSYLIGVYSFLVQRAVEHVHVHNSYLMVYTAEGRCYTC